MTLNGKGENAARSANTESPVIYDRRGIPILPGDTVKMFHYTARQRREKRYMYKYVLEIHLPTKPTQVPLLKLSHLSQNGEWFWMHMDGKTHPDLEVVQGYAGVPPGQDFRDRKRKQLPK